MIENALRPIRQKVMGIVVRGILEATKDGQGIQLVKTTLLAGETREDMERAQNYGLTSHAPDGSEVTALFVSGNREHGIIITCENRTFRLKSLAKGEVALYTDEGDKIHFKRGNVIDVDCNTLELGRGTLEKIVNGETFQGLFNAHPHFGNLGVITGGPTTQMGSSELSSVVKAAT